MIRAPPFGLLCTKTYVRHVHEAVGLLPVRASCEVDWRSERHVGRLATVCAAPGSVLPLRAGRAATQAARERRRTGAWGTSTGPPARRGAVVVHHRHRFLPAKPSQARVTTRVTRLQVRQKRPARTGWRNWAGCRRRVCPHQRALGPDAQPTCRQRVSQGVPRRVGNRRLVTRWRRWMAFRRLPQQSDAKPCPCATLTTATTRQLPSRARCVTTTRVSSACPGAAEVGAPSDGTVCS